MAIFNHISKDKTNINVQDGITRFDIIFSDYARKDNLLQYYNKSMPITTTNPINMGGNRITSLADPTVDTDGINRSFLNKKISTATKNLKSEISTSVSDLTKTNNVKVNELETKITNGAIALSEMNKSINNEIKAITITLDILNKKDTLTDDEIKKINNKLVSAIKSIDTTMLDFNKMLIDTEEIQSEITKLKNSMINSLTEKNTADTEVIKTDISNIKYSNEEIKGQITNIENLFNDKIKTADSAIKTATEGLDKKITETNTKINEEKIIFKW